MREMTVSREPSPNDQRVAFYARIASHPFDGWLEHQLVPAKALLEAHKDWTLSSVYADEGIPASQHRPQLEAMLNASDAGEIDIVITASMTRLARGMADLAKIIERLSRSGTKLILLKEGVNTDEAPFTALFAGISERRV